MTSNVVPFGARFNLPTFEDTGPVIEPEIFVSFEDIRRSRRLAEDALRLGFYFDVSKFTVGELMVYQKIVGKLSKSDCLWLASIAARENLQLWAGIRDIKMDARMVLPPAAFEYEWQVSDIPPDVAVSDILLKRD